MRVFIPATLGMLDTLRDQGRMPVRSGTAFASTPALFESYAEGDQEEIEHIAFQEAARASIRLLAGEDSPNNLLRRVVVSVDVPDSAATLRPDLDLAVVRLEPSAVSFDQVAAVHVDLEAATEFVRAAINVIDEADLGGEDAELTVGDALDRELAWYDPVELPFLLSLL